MIPAAPGITPGSGPGHLRLFGYDPLDFPTSAAASSSTRLGVELAARRRLRPRNFRDAR